MIKITKKLLATGASKCVVLPDIILSNGQWPDMEIDMELYDDKIVIRPHQNGAIKTVNQGA